ncbi:MAG: peptidoglycan DD-metalloendopeptidase family protein [Pseudomonadota bacterium]
MPFLVRLAPAFLLVAGLVLSLAPSAGATDERQPPTPVPAPTPPPQSSPEKLREMEETLKERQQQAERLTEEARRLRAEIATLQNDLIRTTETVQLQEASVLVAEEELAQLRQDEVAISAGFEAQQAALVETLAALQMLQTQPPPALLVEPDDAAGAVRSAMLLSTVVPALKAEADRLARELEQLRALRQEIVEREANREERERKLEIQERELRRRLTRAETAYSSIADRAVTERKAASSIERQASELKQIIDSLESRALRYLPRLKPNPGDPGERIALLPRQKPQFSPLLGRVLSQRPLPSDADRPRTFSAALGGLRLPVNGRLVEIFGEILEAGGRAKGIKLETRAKAQVVAPFAGEVVAAGAYKPFGQILIIEVEREYLLVMAGLDRLYSDVGRSVKAGEPIGEMGESAVRALWPDHPIEEVAASHKSRPILYVEFRKGGVPFDPLPWFATAEKKVKGS